MSSLGRFYLTAWFSLKSKLNDLSPGAVQLIWFPPCFKKSPFCRSQSDYAVCEQRRGFQPCCDVSHKKSHTTFKRPIMNSHKLIILLPLWCFLHNLTSCSQDITHIVSIVWSIFSHFLWWNFSNCSWLQHICSYFTALWCPLWSINSGINLDWICRSRTSNSECKICKVSKYVTWHILLH